MNHAASRSSFLAAIMDWRKPFVVFAALGLVGMMGWIDYVTGWEWNFSAIYALPIVLVVFRTDQRAGFALAILCAVTFWVAHIETNPFQTTAGFALAVVSTGFYFVVVVVASAAVKAQWELGRGRIAMLERTRDLEREIVQTTEREQQRIGRELHDGLCQTLAGIAALSTAFSRRSAASSEFDASAAAAEITKLLNEAIGEARDLARGLGPVGMKEAGLAGALEGLALNVRHRYGISCTLECDGLFPKLGSEVEAHLFRIAQEAANNAVSHGQAERIEISLSGVVGKGLLSVRDNGVGLPGEALHGEGIGLQTMAYRARLIGGSLEVRRQVPGGTAVACAFPLPTTPDTRAHPDHARNEN